MEAITRKVREIDLILPRMSFKFPQLAFTCETLVVLKLSGGIATRVPTSACLPNLKTLALRSVIFRDDESATKLINCCPKLENLSMWRVVWLAGVKRLEESMKVSIHATKLKCLEMDFHVRMYNQEYNINAPSLEYLDMKCHSYSGVSLSLTNVGCLKRANVCWTQRDAHQSLVKWFEAFNNLKFLSLSYEYQSYGHSMAFDLLEQGLEVVNLFNLTHLTVDFRSPWRSMLPYFFLCFPNLQVLKLEKCSSSLSNIRPNIMVQLLPPNLLSKLRVVEIEDCWDSMYDLDMLKYILENGIASETVRIHMKDIDHQEYLDSIIYTAHAGGREWGLEERFLVTEQKSRELELKMRIAQEISGFCRASARCKITYT